MIKTYTFLFLLFICQTILLAQSNPLPFNRTVLFAGSGRCAVCHESDGQNVMTINGIDVSPVTYWRSTMMGNASKDPFWRAVVAEEVHRFPALQQTIETTCTRCHSPMGYTEAFHNGATNYSIAQMKADDVANDGVSCTVCHQIKPDNFGMTTSYSGHYEINLDSIIYGPYQDPNTEIMYDMSFFTPVYTNHLNKSELCATCHTVFTPYLDNQGQIAGNFPEQTSYIEWKNSIYPERNTQCQSCHMPMINDSVIISSIPPSYPVFRSPFWKHVFVGGNSYILRMLRGNVAPLGLTASEQNFDSTIVRTEENLTKKAINLFITTTYENDSLNVFVKIENKAGHKIPGGIPLRRIWIHLKVTDQLNTVVFESGNYNLIGEIAGLNSDYEPHYDLITNENEVQIYEGVMGDVDSAVTNSLLRASHYLKDNRIPPKGFTTTHASYDTTAIVGDAASDPNFNKDTTGQGTGSDIVNYRFSVTGEKNYKVFAEVCYQSIKPEFVNQLASVSEPDIDQFIGMYNNLPNIPVILKSDSVNIFVSDVTKEISTVNNFTLLQNYPNPFNPSTVISWHSSVSGWQTLKIYDVLGNEVATLVDEYKPAGSYKVEFNPVTEIRNLASGIYFYRIVSGNFVDTKKMLLVK